MLDSDALHAIAWIDGGISESEIAYGADAPKLTVEQMRQFRPASYIRAPNPSRRRSRIEKTDRTA